MKEQRYIAFFNANGDPVGMPTAIDSVTEADAELECIPSGALYHGIYIKSELLNKGYAESDFDGEDE